MRKFSPPSPVIPGLVRAFTLLVPASEVQPLPGTVRRSVHWTPVPAVGQVVEFSLLLSEPGCLVSGWPGKRSMGTSLVGRLSLPDGRAAWVVSRVRLEASDERQAWDAWKRRALERLGTENVRQTRALSFGRAYNGSWFFVDLHVG